MNDQNPDPTTTANIAPLTGDILDGVKKKVDAILDLDSILSSARLVERTVRICVDGQLENEYNDVVRELAPLVEADGTPIAEEEVGIGEVSQIERLQARSHELLAAMEKVTLAVTFQALPSDEWEAFDKSHRTGAGAVIKDQRKFENELIATCAVTVNGQQLTLTAEDVVAKFRKRLNQAQFVTLYNSAYFVNMRDGIDIPKSQSFLHAPKPQE